MSSDVYRVKIDLRLEVEDVGDFEVVDFQMNFGINEIPTAVASLAIGRNALSTSQRAKIHDSAASLKSMLKAKVYATIKGQFGDDKEWPEDEVMIFDGRLAGTGFNRLLGQASYSMHLTHWLSDLAFSSTLSQQSHPGNPSQLTYGAVRYGFSTAGSKESVMFGSSSPKKLFTGKNVKEDMWAKAMHPMLCQLCERDFIDIEGELKGISEKNRKNDLAKAALARFEGGGCGVEPSEGTPPLSLFHDGSATEEVASSIRDTVGRVVTQSAEASTVWDLLVGPLAQNFLFSVVPQVDRALVVPIMPGLRDAYDVSIEANDYDLAELSGSIPRPLRGVGIIGGIESKWGQNTGGQIKLGGFWPEEGDVDPVPDGMIRVLSAPSWIANIPMGVGRARSTSGTADTKPSSTSTTPVTEDVKPADATTRSERTIEAQGFYKRFAHAMYVNEVLRGRNGAVSGKLRFDIAPGATVKIEGKHEAFIGSSDQLGEDLYGTVTKVSVGLNAEAGRAGTGFSIAGHRTATENEDERFTTDKHPLYRQAFKGAPLVPKYKL